MLYHNGLQEGANVGRYRIERPLGAGGMGVVYVATDELLARRVALKVLPFDRLSDDVSRQRLLREARAAAALDHPNLCPVFDAGEHEGLLFIAMQLLEGETLAMRLTRGSIVPSEALGIAREIASALVEAHGRQIVHRDLKPGNIMLTPRGTRILDFGLAHVLSGDYEQITREGEITGTVPYMAPEQLGGRETGSRADIFSLGVVVYEMIAGQRPFRGSNPAAIMHAILHDRMPSLPSIGRSFQAAEALLGRMLSKDPALRPSAVLVLEEIDRIVAGGDLSADEPTVSNRRPNPDESRPLVSHVPSASGAERWGSDASLVSAVIDPEAKRHYLKGRHLWNKRTPPAVKESMEHYQKAIDLDPLFPQAYIGIADSSMYLSFLDFVSPRIVVAKARAAAHRALDLAPESSQAHATLGWIAAVYDWDWTSARGSFEEALRLDDSNALAHHWYGILLSMRGETDEARRQVVRAFELDPLSPIHAVALSLPEYYSGQFEKAARMCREVVESEPSFPAARFYLGRALEEAGRLAEAIEVWSSIESMVEVEMEHTASLASGLDRVGRSEEAAAIEKRLVEASSRRYISPFYFALIASGRRASDATLEHLERAVEDHATRIVELHVDPRFEWLHGEARFRELVDRVGFAPLRAIDE